MYNHTIKEEYYNSNVDAAFAFLFMFIIFLFICGLWWAIFYESQLFFKGNAPSVISPKDEEESRNLVIERVYIQT